MKRTLLALSISLIPALVLAQGVAPPPADEDNGPATSGFFEAITPIACPGTILIEVDFDAIAGGPVTVADIQAAFPTAAVADITLTPPTTPFNPGTYNTNPSGRALAGNPDLSLSLFLVDPPAGVFGAFGDMIWDLGLDATEFGVQIGDWNGPANVEVYDDGGLVGSAQFDAAGAAPFCFMSDVPFDEVLISLNPDNPNGNWVVPTIWAPDLTIIPTTPMIGLVVLAVALLVISLLVIRRLMA